MRTRHLPYPAAISLLVLAALAAGCASGSSSSNATAPARVLPSAAPPTSQLTAAPTPSVQQHTHTVAISAGHGGPDNVGAVHKNSRGAVDLVEKDLNLDVARRLDQLLRASGYRTVMIRDGDYSLTPTVPGDFAATTRNESQARADKANAAGADIILAIHHNGSNDARQAGTSVYYNPDRSFGAASGVLATDIYNEIIARLHDAGYDSPPRGVMSDSATAAAALTGGSHTFLLGEIPGFRPTNMPGMIGEALFVSNDTEAVLLQRDEVRQAIAQGYKDGIDSYFSLLSAQQAR